MSKAVSYYDWELSFKHKNKPSEDSENDNFNKIGLSNNNFKDFLKKWKEKNLS